MISRAEKSLVAHWWWTVDRWLLTAIGLLVIIGFVLTMAGSPAVADRLGLSSFYFVRHQAIFILPGIMLLLTTSCLSPRAVRRANLLLFVSGMILIGMALLYGHEIKGARRWIFGIQPSEFVKPAFVILIAWALSEGERRPDLPGNFIALLLLPLTIVPLILQPDFGQTMLLSLTWAALIFMAGIHWFWIAAIGGIGSVSVLTAYKLVPHVHARILQFIDPNNGPGVTDRFQIYTAQESFISGGWFGKGPGEGTFKRVLPDAHTDFIFAATGEEFGLLFCIVLAGLFAFIVLRGLLLASRNDDSFCRFATVGLGSGLNQHQNATTAARATAEA